MVDKRRRRESTPDVQTADEVVNVHSTYLGQETNERKVIQVKSFAVEPAHVRVNKGFTANMGDYESLRVDVSITVPCYVEEIDEVVREAADKVHVFLMEELKRNGVEY